MPISHARTRDAGHRRRTRGRRGRRDASAPRPSRQRRLAAPQGRRDRAAGAAGAGRLRPGCRRPRRSAHVTCRAIIAGRSASSPRSSRTTPSTSPRRCATSSAGRTRASASPTSSIRSWPSSRSSTGSTASVISSSSRCTRRTARAIATSRRCSSRSIWPEFIARARDGDYTQQAVRLAAVRRLHAGLRHQLGGALPRDRRDARDPDLHVGRDLPGPRGRALSARRPRRPPRSRSSSCPTEPRACSTTRSSPRRRS